MGFLRADTARHAPGHRGREISAFYGALLGTGVIASVLCGVLDSFTYRNGFLEIAASTGGVIVVYMLVTVFMLPLFFKLGAEKARVAMTLCFILPFLLIVWGFSWLGDGAAAFVESLPLADDRHGGRPYSGAAVRRLLFRVCEILREQGVLR